jgi:hypothetical protein
MNTMKLASTISLGDIAAPNPLALAICVGLSLLTILLASRAA